ncbi:MAG: hypothetical protein ACRCSY_06185 [Cetobacterium sp.]
MEKIIKLIDVYVIDLRKGQRHLVEFRVDRRNSESLILFEYSIKQYSANNIFTKKTLASIIAGSKNIDELFYLIKNQLAEKTYYNNKMPKYVKEIFKQQIEMYLLLLESVLTDEQTRCAK